MPICRTIALSLGLLAAGQVATAALVAGPMIGSVTSNSARVWVQFSDAGQLTVNAYDLQARQIVGGVRVDLDGPAPFVSDVPLQGLRPDHSYRLEFKFDGEALNLPEMTVRTAPVPGEETNFSVAFGSDINANPVGSWSRQGAATPDLPPMPMFSAINAAKPRAFIFLGNTGHLPASLDDFPATHRETFRMLTDFQSAMRQSPALEQLFLTTPCYAVFGAHDFGPAGAMGNYPFANESLVAFEKFWPNPDWGTPQNPGCFTTFSMGDVDFFLLDAQTFHTAGAAAGAGDAATQPAKTPALLGDAQLDWLKKGLKASKAHFKVLAASCTLWGDAPGHPDAESWSNFPVEQQAFLTWLGDAKIDGLITLSGNHAAGEVTRFKAPGLAYPLFTVATSSLVLPPGARLAAPADNPQREGKPIPACTFGTLDFGGEQQHRFVTLRLRDERGKVVAEQTILAPELRN